MMQVVSKIVEAGPLAAVLMQTSAKAKFRGAKQRRPLMMQTDVFFAVSIISNALHAGMRPGKCAFGSDYAWLC